MRKRWARFVPLWRASAFVCALLLLLSCLQSTATEYDAGTPITAVSITNPVASEVWLAGSDHTLTCTTATDTDQQCETYWYDVDDSVTHYWTGSGSFKNNVNIGTSVTYICTDTSGGNTVTVYADDDYAPDSNTAIVDETPTSDSETVTVVVPQLEWVEWGGSKKHTLYKKDANQWNPANELFATDYDEAVPNKAWVRSPALQDPVCYTKNADGSEVTTSINFSTAQAVTEASTVNTTSDDASCSGLFKSTGVTVNAAAVTVPTMNLEAPYHVVDYVTAVAWETISWYYKDPDGSDTWIGIGDSDNTGFATWGTPAGDTPTARRMLWATSWCSGDTTVTGVAGHLAAGVRANTNFGGDNPATRWPALDGTLTNDCLAASYLAVKALNLLGITACDAQRSYASTDDTEDADYPSDVTAAEYDGEPEDDDTLLWYSDDGGAAGSWNRFEGSFKAQDGATWKYWTIWASVTGPFVGTGDNAAEKDKSARYQVLDYIHDYTDYVQKHGMVRAAADLPQ